MIFQLPLPILLNTSDSKIKVQVCENKIADFFRLPYEGLTRGPGAFVSGVSRGTTSFVKHISKGSYFGSCNNALFSFLPLFFISKKHVKVVSALSLPLALCDFLARSEMLDL